MTKNHDDQGGRVADHQRMHELKTDQDVRQVGDSAKYH